MTESKKEVEFSISQKESLGLTDVDVVQNYWNHANHGHFNLDLYEKILIAKNQKHGNNN